MSESLINVEMRLVDILDRLMEAEESGNPVPSDLEEVAASYAIEAAEKRDACARFLSFVEGMEEQEAGIIKAHQKRKAALQSAREKFTAYLLSVMQSRGVKISAGQESKFVVTLHDAVEITDEEALPDTLLRVKKEPNKAAIKTALEVGAHVPGARLVKRASLRVSPLAVKDVPSSVLVERAN